LNAAQLDGQEASAFMRARTYQVDRPITIEVVFSTAVSCDPGDLAIGSARANKDADTEMVRAAPSIANPGVMGLLDLQRLNAARRHAAAAIVLQ
jgi:hypothetical protein